MAKAKEAREAVEGNASNDVLHLEAGFDRAKKQLLNNESASMTTQEPIEAASRLAAQLTDYADRTDVLVLTLRNGVQVAVAVASALRAPLDLILVRKLCVPWEKNVIMGAVATGGVRVIYEDVVRELRVPAEVMDLVMEREFRKLKRQERAYRGGRPAPDVLGQTVILVNDGLTNGSTTRAATAAIRNQQPKELIVAVPNADVRACDTFRAQADRIVLATMVESAAVTEKLHGPARRVLQFMRAERKFRKGSHCRI